VIPGAFAYHRPKSIKEAVAMLADLGEDARPLAGGHSLIPMMKLRLAAPAHVVDLGGIGELRGIRAEGGDIVIGAMTTQHELIADATLAAQYVAEARELGRTVGLGGDVTLAWVLERPGVVRMQDTETPASGIAWPVLAEVLGRALDELVACRGAEGEALGAELRTLHAALRMQVDAIAARTPAALARYQDRLRERIGALLGEIVRDEGRILTEVAIWADKTDVREEMTRLGAHLEQLTLLLDKGGAVGRALDFLIQELNREVNTIASKADDLELSQAALAAKGIIEKVREQAQNLE